MVDVNIDMHGGMNVNLVAAHQEPVVSALKLPSTYSDLRSIMTNWSSNVELQRSALEEVPAGKKLIARFCGDSLRAGRLLNKAMLVMCGQTGVGISHCLKGMFGGIPQGASHLDDGEPQDQLLEYWTTLQTDRIEGRLHVVDLPGFLSPYPEQVARGLADALQFQRQTFGEKRDDTWATEFFCGRPRLNSYPNFVVFVVSCLDERMEGAASGLRQSLTVLKTCGLVDPVRPNLLILGNRMGTIPGHLQEQTARCVMLQVQAAVADIFGITESPVLFDYTHVLPAFRKMAQAAGDTLGQHLAESLLSSSTFSVTATFSPLAIRGWTTRGDDEAAAQLLRQKEILPSFNTELPRYQYSHIGRGFNAAAGKLRTAKPVLAFGNSSMAKTKIGARLYLLPQPITLLHSKEVYLQRRSVSTSKPRQRLLYDRHAVVDLDCLNPLNSYQRQAQQQRHGLPTSGALETCQVVFGFEVCLAFLRVDNADEHLLPGPSHELLTLNEAWFYGWSAGRFLRKWGTDIVIQERLGGCVELECEFTCQELERGAVDAFETELDTHLRQLHSSNRHTFKPYNGGGGQAGSNNNPITGVKLSGLHISLESLEELTFDLYHDWLNGLPEQLSSLTPQRQDLMPFHQTLSSRQGARLAVETDMYIQRELGSGRHRWRPRRPSWQLLACIALGCVILFTCVHIIYILSMSIVG